MDTEVYKTSRPNRQQAIETLPLGESVAICHRVDLSFGLSDEEKNKHSARLRGNLDSQVNRTRRKYSTRQFKVESLIAPTTQSAALIFLAVCTRVA